MTSRFEREVLPHVDRVVCAALYLTGDRAEAGELVQETFATAYAAFGQLASGTNVTAWLYRILIGTVASSRVKQREPQPAQPNRSGVSPAEIRAVMRLPGPVIRGALQQLQPNSRLVVYLADVEGLACREIADITGASIETVRRRRHTGRRQLAELLRDYAAARRNHND